MKIEVKEESYEKVTALLLHGKWRKHYDHSNCME